MTLYASYASPEVSAADAKVTGVRTPENKSTIKPVRISRRNLITGWDETCSFSERLKILARKAR